MLNSNKKTYDAIIIGAGISGLVCACYLAKAGMKVLIVEQHDKPGGYFTSFKKKGFLFDAAAHSFGNYKEGAHVRKTFTELGIDKLIEVERFSPSNIVVTPDFEVSFSSNVETTINNLASIFPEERHNITNFFNFASSASQTEFAKLKNKTFNSLLSDYFTNSKLISVLASPVFGSGGLPPSFMHAFIGIKIFSEFILDGGYYPKGGIQNLPNAMAHIIKKNAGTVFYKRLVKKILCNNNKVIGVELDNHESVTAKYVVSACDMIQTFSFFLDQRLLNNHAQDRLKSMTPSLSFFMLYVGLNKPFTGFPPSGTNMWCLPYYDLDEIYHNTIKCTFDGTSMYLLRLSPDSKSLIASFLATYKTRSFWSQHKQQITQDFLSGIEKFIPNLKKHIAYTDSATPATLYRYTSNHEGAAFGWSKSPSQIFDPLFCKTTFVEGLYLAGHWTGMGFGMPGACYSGHDVAKRILRRENINR